MTLGDLQMWRVCVVHDHKVSTFVVIAHNKFEASHKVMQYRTDLVGKETVAVPIEGGVAVV